MRAHALLTLLFVLSRAALDAAGLRFYFSLDWMWLADPADLRARLPETLLHFHAFPPGMNLLTGVLLKLGGPFAPVLGHAAFMLLGVVFVNALFHLGRVTGLSVRAAFAFALAFLSTPPAIYFEHLYHYDWVIATLLAVVAVLFHEALTRRTLGAWLACFAVCAVIGLTRSTFHLVWFVALVVLAAWLSERGSRRLVLAAAALPAAVLGGLYVKNLILFGEFAASTFGPASYTLVTVARLPPDVRDDWTRQGRLSPFAGVSVYAPPREYARFFASADHARWPPPLTRLDHTGVHAPNFNHWWLLEVHRARRADAFEYLRRRPGDYARNVLDGVHAMFLPSTEWHPRDGTEASPHHQHRLVLGRYEAAFNRALHAFPVPPIGLYLLLPLPMLWALVHARRLRRSADRRDRVRAAVLLLIACQIVYVVAASTMLTALESARYRYQIESFIWLITALGSAALIPRVSAAIGLSAWPAPAPVPPDPRDDLSRR